MLLGIVMLRKHVNDAGAKDEEEDDEDEEDDNDAVALIVSLLF